MEAYLNNKNTQIFLISLHLWSIIKGYDHFGTRTTSFAGFLVSYCECGLCRYNVLENMVNTEKIKISHFEYDGEQINI